MRPVEILKKKRERLELSPPETGFLVRGCSSGFIPGYQITAFLYARLFPPFLILNVLTGKGGPDSAGGQAP